MKIGHLKAEIEITPEKVVSYSVRNKTCWNSKFISFYRISFRLYV